MRRSTRPWRSLFLVIPLLLVVPAGAQNQQAPKKAKSAKKEKRAEEAADLPAVLWRDPGDIASRDLTYGSGGKEHAPGENESYKFVKEDLNGTATKFYVEDNEGVQWLVKLGEEAQPETAAARFIWAMGYFADEDYYLHTIRVSGVPHLHRGNKDIQADGTVAGVRLKRQSKTEKNVGNWSWFDNPFVNTRELDGLRVVEALINNWDLKEDNNKIYAEDETERRYVDSDLGASFGRTGGVSTRSKGNLQQFKEAKFIDHLDENEVAFVMATRPLFLFKPFEPSNFAQRVEIEDVVKHIPRGNAKWMSQQLSHLTEKQIGDAFRAAGYSDDEVEGYTQAMMARIAKLGSL